MVQAARKPLGLVVYKPLYFVLKGISNQAHLSSPHHSYSWSPPPQLSCSSRCHLLATLVVIVACCDFCVSLCHLVHAHRTHHLSSCRVVPLFLAVSLGHPITPKVFTVVPHNFPQLLKSSSHIYQLSVIFVVPYQFPLFIYLLLPSSQTFWALSSVALECWKWQGL